MSEGIEAYRATPQNSCARHRYVGALIGRYPVPRGDRVGRGRALCDVDPVRCVKPPEYRMHGAEHWGDGRGEGGGWK
jgi:hypothetical protein